MSNYWLHRISHHSEVSYPLLLEDGHENFLSIGWKDVAKKFPNIRDNEDPNLDKLCKEMVKETYNITSNKFKSWKSLYNFICFKKNDYIVVPTRDKDFVVCEVLEDKTYIFSEIKYNIGDTVDLGFFKKVKVLPGFIPRNGFADKKLTARMKIRQTNASIDDIKDSVKEAIERFKEKKPISLYGELSEEFLEQTIKKIHKLSNPDNFEKLIESYFKHIGASVVDIPSKNSPNKSGDADIIATFDTLKLIICVQAKLHEGESDSWAIDQIFDYSLSKEDMDGYSRILWVIDACEKFNIQAINEAAKKKVRLIDGKEFAKMLLDVGLKAFDFE